MLKVCDCGAGLSPFGFLDSYNGGLTKIRGIPMRCFYDGRELCTAHIYARLNLKCFSDDFFLFMVTITWMCAVLS